MADDSVVFPIAINVGKEKEAAEEDGGDRFGQHPFDVHGTDSNNGGDEDVSDDLLDTRDISTYWKDEIGAMTDPPIGWPLESYNRSEETEFITTVLKTAAERMEMDRVLAPNQYPYDIMYCLFVVRPNDTLKTCQENMRGTYKETIAYLFHELGLRRDFSCVEFTLATDTVSQCISSDTGHDRYKFVIYQTNSEDDIFHVELWRSRTNVPEGRRSEYMSWYSAMHNRTKALALFKLDTKGKEIKVIAKKYNHTGTRTECVSKKKLDNDTGVKVTVVSGTQVSLGPHVKIKCIEPPARPNVKWAVRVLKTDLASDRVRQLYTHVLGRGTFGVVYGVTENVVCKMVHNLHEEENIALKCMDSFEEAAITMVLSKCDHITRLYYATLGVNTVNHRYACYMFMERATLPLDVVFAREDSSRHNWLKPIVEHDTLQALAYMHKYGFVHRDLKFNNMLLFIQEGHAVIKLCDLGCSQMGYSATSRSGDMHRAPPEVLIYPLYSPASDMFSWAVVMWTMYTGSIPLYRKEYSIYSITRTLFRIVGCYRNMAKYDKAGPHLKGAEHLCGHKVCALDSHQEFDAIRNTLYSLYAGHSVPINLAPLLVTNMSIFPQRRYTATALLTDARYTDINKTLKRCRTVLRREHLDGLNPMPGLLFDRESEFMRAALVEHSSVASKNRPRWSHRHKTYYGHEHFDITANITAKTNKFSIRNKGRAPKITYLTAPANERYSKLGSLLDDADSHDTDSDDAGSDDADDRPLDAADTRSVVSDSGPSRGLKRQKTSSSNSSLGSVRHNMKIHKPGQAPDPNPAHARSDNTDGTMVDSAAQAPYVHNALPFSYASAFGLSDQTDGVATSDQTDFVATEFDVGLTSERSESLPAQGTMVQAQAEKIDSDLTKMLPPTIELKEGGNLPAPELVSVTVLDLGNADAQAPGLVAAPAADINLLGHSVDPPVLADAGFAQLPSTSTEKTKKKNEKDKRKKKKREKKKEHETTDNTRSRSARTRESETVDPPVLEAAPATTLPSTAIPHCDRRPSAGDRDSKRVSKKKKSETADNTARSRSSRTSESEIEDDRRVRSPATQVGFLTKPKYFLRRGYPDNPNIRDVIYETDIVIGQPILPWYKHYMYVLALSELTKLSVLPIRDSNGAFMVYPFAHGPTCGVMYVTANVGNPLNKYVMEWHNNPQNKQMYEAIFPAAVCQLAIIMFKLNRRKIVPKRPLCLGDLWWNKVTKTVRLDLFNIAITNELELNSDNPFNVWGRPLLCDLARLCKMQKLVGDTIEKTICALQKNEYSLRLIEHTTYMPDMLARFRPKDPMGNTLVGSWCKNV